MVYLDDPRVLRITYEVRKLELSLDITRRFVTRHHPDRPDPNWICEDKAGHVHKYGPEFTTPTLSEKSEMKYQYLDEYETDEWEDRWLECRKCGERILPGMLKVPATQEEIGPEVSGHAVLRIPWHSLPTEIALDQFDCGVSGTAAIVSAKSQLRAGVESRIHVKLVGIREIKVDAKWGQ